MITIHNLAELSQAPEERVIEILEDNGVSIEDGTLVPVREARILLEVLREERNLDAQALNPTIMQQVTKRGYTLASRLIDDAEVGFSDYHREVIGAAIQNLVQYLVDLTD